MASSNAITLQDPLHLSIALLESALAVCDTALEKNTFDEDTFAFCLSFDVGYYYLFDTSSPNAKWAELKARADSLLPSHEWDDKALLYVKKAGQSGQIAKETLEEAASGLSLLVHASPTLPEEAAFAAFFMKRVPCITKLSEGAQTADGVDADTLARYLEWKSLCEYMAPSYDPTKQYLDAVDMDLTPVEEATQRLHGSIFMLKGILLAAGHTDGGILGGAQKFTADLMSYAIKGTDRAKWTDGVDPALKRKFDVVKDKCEGLIPAWTWHY